MWRELGKLHKNKQRKREGFLLSLTGIKRCFISQICQVIATISTWLSAEVTAHGSLVFWNTSPVSNTLGDISAWLFPGHPTPPGWTAPALPAQRQACRAWSHEKAHQDLMKSQCLEPLGSTTFLQVGRCLPKSEWTDSEDDYIVTRKIKMPWPLQSKHTAAQNPSLYCFWLTLTQICLFQKHIQPQPVHSLQPFPPPLW